MNDDITLNTNTPSDDQNIAFDDPLYTDPVDDPVADQNGYDDPFYSTDEEELEEDEYSGLEDFEFGDGDDTSALDDFGDE